MRRRARPESSTDARPLPTLLALGEAAAASDLTPRPLLSALTLMATDWCAVFAALVLVWSLRWGPLQSLFPQLPEVAPLSYYIIHLWGLMPWLLAFAEARLYTRRMLFWEEARRVVYACSLAALFAVAISFAGKTSDTLSRLLIGGLWLATLLVVPVARWQAKKLLLALGIWRKRVLILGAGDTGVQIVDRIRANPDLGYHPVAFVDDDAAKIGTQVHDLPVRGPLASLPHLIDQLAIKDVVVALPSLPRDRLLHLISSCEGRVQSIRLVPDLFGLASVGVEAEDLDGVLLLHMRWNLAKPWNLAAKRGFDVLVGGMTAFVLLPFLVALAIVIRLDSAGPVLFVDDRLGRGQRAFRCFKFRSMYLDSEERLREHLSDDAVGREEWQRFAKLKSVDPRITRVGRVMRRFSFDELPQLLNVLRGDMSLVGPRPYLPSETERMGDLGETILKAPPGITGLWQVSGRNHLTFEQRLRLDEYYVRNWSLWTDAVVLLKTLGAVVRGDGAY